MNKTTHVFSKANAENVYIIIKHILSSGRIVRFTNKINGITKDVNAFNLDSDGDLTAFRHTGTTPYVCPVALEYEISAIEE